MDRRSCDPLGMDWFSREALKQRMMALGQNWPDAELDRIVPALAQNLPLMEALAAFPFGEHEPAVRFQMQAPTKKPDVG